MNPITSILSPNPSCVVPLWAAQAAAGIGCVVGGELVETAAAAGAIGYYAVRLQDDLMDEGIGDPAAIAVLSSAVLAAAQSTLGSMGLSARFWGWHSECDVALRRGDAVRSGGPQQSRMATTKPPSSGSWSGRVLSRCRELQYSTPSGLGRSDRTSNGWSWRRPVHSRWSTTSTMSQRTLRWATAPGYTRCSACTPAPR